MIFVIGSGPAAIAAASALLSRGLKVTLVDVGNELEDEIQKKLQHFKENPNLSKLEDFKYELSSDDDIQLSYGSDFVYRQNGLIQFITDGEVYCKPSLAKGGVSNVWGAFVDSYSDEDLSDWPFAIEALKPYYEQVLQFLPLASDQTFKLSDQAHIC